MNPKSEDNSDYTEFNADVGSLEVAEQDVRRANTNPTRPPRFPNRKRLLIGMLFALAVIAALVASGVSLMRSSSKPQPNVTINTQSLDNGTLNQLTTEDGGAGKQQLTISPDTLFNNNVTVNKDLTVVGTTTLQSAVNIANNLAIGGNTSVGGNLSVTGQIAAGNLNVGSMTISSLKLSGDLEFNGHLVPTGAAPTIKASVAAAGGSATITGSDTAGTLTITVGSGGVSMGEMAVITFRAAYGGTPKVQLTPVNGSASKLDYFVTRSAGFFTVEATSLPTAGTSYTFDYFVTQ